MPLQVAEHDELQRETATLRVAFYRYSYAGKEYAF
jgi:hypothetical protein